MKDGVIVIQIELKDNNLEDVLKNLPNATRWDTMKVRGFHGMFFNCKGNSEKHMANVEVHTQRSIKFKATKKPKRETTIKK